MEWGSVGKGGSLADCRGAVLRGGVRAMHLVTQILIPIRWLVAALSSCFKMPR